VGREVTPRGWWVVDLVCGLLDRDERAAVCGDLIEAHVSTGRALIEVGGLVVRRQAALWLGWQPWLALFTVVAPLGVLLSLSSRWFAGIAAHLWLYVRLGEWSYLTIPGWRRDVIEAATTALAGFAALALWSWSAGFVLARLSRKAWWTLGLVLALVIVLTIGRVTNARGFTLTPTVRLLLVLLPMWSGLRRGVNGTALGAVRALAIAVATIAITAFMSKALEGSLTYGWVVPPQPGPDGIFGTGDDLRPLWWVSLVMLWPTAYVVMNSIRGRASRR
jgi:hypothetical protein